MTSIKIHVSFEIFMRSKESSSRNLSESFSFEGVSDPASVCVLLLVVVD